MDVVYLCMDVSNVMTILLRDVFSSSSSSSNEQRERDPEQREKNFFDLNQSICSLKID